MRASWARSSAALDEPRLLPGVRLPEPGGRELLLPAAARYLRRDEQGETTLSLAPEELGDEPAAAGEPRGPALVVRAGGGRAGETFETAGLRTLIGRSPDCDVFLDDVTVSRRHAEIVREDGDGSRSRISAASTGRSSTATGSRARCSRTTTRSRSASTG